MEAATQEHATAVFGSVWQDWVPLASSRRVRAFPISADGKVGRSKIAYGGNIAQMIWDTFLRNTGGMVVTLNSYGG